MSLNNPDGAELARAKRMLANVAPQSITAQYPELAAAVNAGLKLQAEQPGYTDKPFELPEVVKTVAAALTPPSFDLEALLEQARTNMSLPMKVADGELPAADPDLVNTLVARADEYKREIDRATKERAKITGLLKEMVLATRVEGADIPKTVALTVHGAPVFAVTHVVKRELDQAAIKAKHPDIAKWAMYWKETSIDSGLYK
jgi:hypothetical protein